MFVYNQNQSHKDWIGQRGGCAVCNECLKYVLRNNLKALFAINGHTCKHTQYKKNMRCGAGHIVITN